MAKKPRLKVTPRGSNTNKTEGKASPDAEAFAKQAPLLLTHLHSILCNFVAGFHSQEVYNVMRETAQSVSPEGTSTRFLDAHSYYHQFRNIAMKLLAGYKAADYYMKAHPKGGYLFVCKPEDRYNISLFSNTQTIPFNEGMPVTVSLADKLKPLEDALKLMGVNLKGGLTGGKMEIKPDPEQEITQGSFIRGVEAIMARRKILPSKLGMKNSAFVAKPYLNVEVEKSDFEVEVTLSLQYEIYIPKSTAARLTDTEDKSTIPFLLREFMMRAASFSRQKSAIRNWKAHPSTDIRKTSDRLVAIQSSHGKARPRTSKDGFCIGDQGLPFYIPVVDHSKAFMKEISQAEVTSNGYYDFETNTQRWASKIIMVDWFNDVLLYTLSDGSLRSHQMLGYRALDKSSEYLLLNTPISDPMFETVLKSLSSAMGIVSVEEALEKWTWPDKPQTLPSFASVFAISSMPLHPSMSMNNKDQEDDNTTHPKLKHLLGIDLDEFPETSNHLNYYKAASCYLRAFNSKRKELTISPFVLLHGIEYMIKRATSLTSGEMDSLREVQALERAKLAPQPIMDRIEVPHLDIGGTLKGFLPHQGITISNLESDVDMAAIDSAAGGGKSLMILVDILRKKMKNPKRKALIATKPGLVRTMVEEINTFSKGEINAVSLRSANIQWMKDKLDINTSVEFLKMIASMPPNTVFICGYTDFTAKSKYFEDLEVPGIVFGMDLSLPQFLHLIRLANFDIMSCDESHLIKHMEAKRSIHAYSAMSFATTRRLASGTILTDTVMDYMGQTFALNPAIYGKNPEAFKNRYGISGGLVKDDVAAAKIRKRLNTYVQTNSSKKEDWSYVLPDLVDKVVECKMTSNQSKYYDAQLLKLLKEAETKLKGNGATIDEQGNAIDKDDFEEEDEFFLAMLDNALSSLSQWLVAPDQSVAFMESSFSASKEDRISPQVREIDKILDRIFSDETKDYSKNKAAIFGIHKVASRHIMQYSRWRHRMIHYEAGNSEALRKFKKMDDIWILTADSTSLREGENLQLITYMFQLESVWSPGQDEQLVSRMYRPDPKGVFSKDYVYGYRMLQSSVTGAPTISTIKHARMASKAISLARVNYEGDPRWERASQAFSGLELLRMSFENIRSLTNESLAPYNDAWESFIKWQNQLNTENRTRIAKRLEEENPGLRLLNDQNQVIDRAEFVSRVLVEPIKGKPLPGAKKAFWVWEPNAKPADPYNLGLEIAGLNTTLQYGEQVWTSFGPAIVHRDTGNQAVVELYGFRKITIHKSQIAIAASEEGKEKLANLIANPSAWRSETIGPVDRLASVEQEVSLAPVKGRKKPRKVEVEEIMEDLEEDDDDTTDEEFAEEFEITAWLVNGYPALVIEEGPDSLDDLGWTHMAPFTSIGFRSWKIATKFLDLASKKFRMSVDVKETLDSEKEMFQTGRGMKLEVRPPRNKIRDFFLDDHRKLRPKGGDDQIKPYWFAFGRSVKLAFSMQAHSPAVFRYIRRIAGKNAGNMNVTVNDGFYIKFFSSPRAAMQEIRALGKEYEVDVDTLKEEIVELQDELRALKGPRQTPSGKKRKKL